MKHKLLKGMFAVFMSVLLIICMFPVTAFATEPTYIYVAGTNILDEPNYTMNCSLFPCVKHFKLKQCRN